ncbi:hypothetical protein CU098_005056 [Rhizopus stolonifer]|uniref:Uncharacterized protein n=1 Tax=Rhizopus stolonifer TaxID=4846 RepID=A0A367IRT2_RHIST|nr:hypothetical protein CU098_005056 [Rhizopus stolonifer]
MTSYFHPSFIHLSSIFDLSLLKMISKSQAICMFFYVDYTEENVKTYRKKIEEFEGSEICWNVREQEPVLVLKQRIRGDPLTYNKYLDERVEDKPKDNKRKRIDLVTEAQVKQFINEIYCPFQPKNQEIYSKEMISTKDIYEIVKTYTTIFHEKTCQSFAVWCRNNKLNFLQAKERKAQTITRELYIMENIFYDDLVSSICTYLPRYQESLKNLKKNGFEIIGYARKSPTNEDVDNRTRLMKSMITNLKERSLATKIFVSPCSWASSPLQSRDLQSNSQDILNNLSVDGNTQDLLTYLKGIDHDVCLVTIDFAGITTRSQDIVNLVEANPSLKKIAIETFALCNELFLFDTQELVRNNDLLQKFDSRNRCIQRSK